VAVVPAYSAARSGVLGDPGAADASAQINQFLGTHGITAVYTGTAIVTPNGSGGTPNGLNLGINDWDQPFTMSGTAIGRVTVPVKAVGDGADLTVTLSADSSGSPGAPIVTTRIPAAWITNLGTAGSLTAATNGPLATAATNQILIGPATAGAWASPAIGAVGSGNSSSAATSGNYIFFVGGLDQARANPITSVFTLAWNGTSLSTTALPQPSLPAPRLYAAVAVGTDTIAVTAGKSSTGATFASDTWTASWNPGTGVVGAWSTQASLPLAIASSASAAWNDTVYVIGGEDNTQLYNTVYWATVTNGQITAWNAGPAYPLAVTNHAAAVVGNFLVVVGGTVDFSTGAETNAVYYAAINSDGSLGVWQAGPSLPTIAAFSPRPNYNIATTDSAVIVVAGFAGAGVQTASIRTLTFNADGPGAWRTATGGVSGLVQCGAFSTGAGSGHLISLATTATYYTNPIQLEPVISIPLPATGLTNGGTYHVTMSQQGGDLNNYLTTGLDANVYAGSPTALFRARSGGSGWSATTAGNAVPVTVFDQTAGGRLPLHLWADSGAKHDMLIAATTPDGTLLGVLEATAQPGPVLNMAPTFTNGTAPWTATGGSVAQSSTYTHGNLPNSAQVTPTGSAAATQLESEQVAVYQGHSYTATAWLYSNVGYSAAVVNLNWYSSSHTLLSTTTGATTALTAGTWTQVATTGAVPSSAAYATVVTAETGTPPSSAVLYVSAAPLQDASGPMLPSVAQINYSSTWPAAISPPLGITQLA
jgi:hypothetical protein